MAINMGLVIHDKINLQNAVDLAAYYGAKKQAQVLNQLAHINYQMRQNYKLLVWRYRVLGNFGNRNHPLFGGNSSVALEPEQPAWSPQQPNNPNRIDPTICISHPGFQELKELDAGSGSVCARNSLGTPPIPPVDVGSGFVPGASEIPILFQNLARNTALYCMESGIMNWAYASRILAHYRMDGALRKDMMYRLAENLSGPNPLDLNNDSIREGVRKTFEMNLTSSNHSGVQDVQYFNSLSQGTCADPRFWMVDIKIMPVLMYSDWSANPSTGECNPSKMIFNQQGAGNPVVNGMDNLPFGFTRPEFAAWANGTRELQGFWSGEPTNPEDRNHSSVGFEKNPWCMVYTGVQATTQVRKPFDPTGGSLTLTARGFAKPFGGRFGPWYGKTWPQGSPHSQGGSRDQMVDPLLPSRHVAGQDINRVDPFGDLANHSRYPGDPLGMNSRRAMAAMIQSIKSTFGGGYMNDGVPAPLAVANYDHLGSRRSLESTGDSLARSGRTSQMTVEPRQRRFEVAALAPDVFDALYYSIEPMYYNNYFTPQTYNGGAQFTPQESLFDFGSTKDGASIPRDFPRTQNNFSVVDQIDYAQRSYMPNYEHHIKDWHHLLNSWHQKGAVDYQMDGDRFGRCQMEVSNQAYPNPGNCLDGGRTGYSVKNISRDYLLSGDHALGGGSNGSKGSILNPPSF